MILAANVFIEYTGMINPRWHPILSLVNKITGWPKMEDGEDPVDTLQKEEEETAESGSKEEPREESREESKEEIREKIKE
jgi:UDP-GlcNAc:undecaprenyl-phosphate GlcNAc-1-phosphate transferase